MDHVYYTRGLSKGPRQDSTPTFCHLACQFGFWGPFLWGVTLPPGVSCLASRDICPLRRVLLMAVWLEGFWGPD